jgi:hypothetical protein
LNLVILELLNLKQLTVHIFNVKSS